MNLRIFVLFLTLSFVIAGLPSVCEASTRKERNLITKGNSLYNERKFVEAQSLYEEAISENSSSAEARYNLALSQIRQVVNPADTSGNNAKLVEQSKKNFSDVASLAKTKPGLAAKANFNLGNIEFNSKDFAKAIEYYKQALRIDPKDDKARKNLRIAQKNLQQQNQDKNQNQQNQQDKQDQENKEENQQNQNNNSDQQNQDQQQQKDQNELSQQSAAGILQAIDNKEAATRARVNKANKGDKTVGTPRNNRKW